MTALYVAAGMSAAFLFLLSSWSLAWQLYAWRTPESCEAAGFTAASTPGAQPRRFSVIVPARHEQAVLGRTLDGLAALDHPDFEVIVVVGHDDDATHQVALAAAERHPGLVSVAVDYNWPKNKPKALNVALPLASGDVLTVIDAEGEVSPGLLSALEATMHAQGADVVQGGVQLVDHHSSWYSVHNVLEYFFWFRSRLHLQAEHGFFPLGGNTFAIRTQLVRAVGGWDEECLAEDCELGVRLSCSGARIVAAYEPALATREETPPSVGQFLRQRTRWNQGFLQVLRKGDWRRLPTRTARLFAFATLASPYLQAALFAALPISIAATLVSVPIQLALVLWLPMLPMLATVLVNLVALVEFCHSFSTRLRLRDAVRLVIGTPFFQMLLALAAARAVWRELRSQRNWELTSHTNEHRAVTTPVQHEAAGRLGEVAA